MIYSDISKYFGCKLSDPEFVDFIKSISIDPQSYSDVDTTYNSLFNKEKSIKLSFTPLHYSSKFDDKSTVEVGAATFCLFYLFPESEKIITLPFEIKMIDNQQTVRHKAGIPSEIQDHHPLYKNDRYKIDNIDFYVHYNIATNPFTIGYVSFRSKIIPYDIQNIIDIEKKRSK